jgi:hypothetical protein
VQDLNEPERRMEACVMVYIILASLPRTSAAENIAHITAAEAVNTKQTYQQQRSSVDQHLNLPKVGSRMMKNATKWVWRLWVM